MQMIASCHNYGKFFKFCLNVTEAGVIQGNEMLV